MFWLAIPFVCFFIYGLAAFIFYHAFQVWRAKNKDVARYKDPVNKAIIEKMWKDRFPWLP